MDIALAAAILVTLSVVLARSLRQASRSRRLNLSPPLPSDSLSVSAQMIYVNAEGDIMDCAISGPHLATWRGGQDTPPVYFSAFCEQQREERTFRFDGIQEITFADEDRPVGKYEGAGLHAMMRLGERPRSVIPEVSPGQRPSAHSLPTPIHVLVRREDAEGNVETFDVRVEQVELADRYVFAFSGRASRRPGETAHARIGRQRFKLRGWDTPGSPILAIAGADGKPITAPHRWLAQRALR